MVSYFHANRLTGLCEMASLLAKQDLYISVGFAFMLHKTSITLLIHLDDFYLIGGFFITQTVFAGIDPCCSKYHGFIRHNVGFGLRAIGSAYPRIIQFKQTGFNLLTIVI